jgi:eukaryotic-like serine/threonine-protein kinase
VDTNPSERFTGKSVGGRFEITSHLGSGGMGEVYLAEDTLLRRAVALKTISQQVGESDLQRHRLRREAQRASLLSHPNIAAVYDLLETNEYVFMIMEYVDGQSLRERLKAPMAVAEALPILIQCAVGLHAAHDRGIVHGDIKPANVMLTGDGTVKICDFGIARRAVAASDDSTTQLGNYGQLAGTPAYMSPELLLAGKATIQSDIFALGVTAYEMLAGWNFFNGGSIPAISDRILNRTPPSLRHISPAVTASLEAIIFKMIEKDAQERPTNLKLVIEALKNVTALAISDTEREVLATSDAPRLKNARNLVVVPFTSIGGDPDAQFYCDGLIETLNARLTRLSLDNPLQVISALDRHNSIRSVDDARRKLGADIVVMGTLQRAETQVRVNYFLVDAGSNRQIFAESITAEYSSPFTLQDRVFEGVTSALRLNLPARAQPEGGSQTRRPGASEFYLQARGYLQNYDRQENLDSAEKLLRKALAVDPNYALAHAGLGEAYWRNFELSKHMKWIEPARQACTVALRISPGLAAGHGCLGLIHNGTGEHERAVAEFKEALAVDPSNDAFYTGLAKAYESLGQNDEAEKTYLEAIQLRPQYWVGYGTLGVHYYKQGQYDRALEMFQHVVTLAPDSTRGHSNLGGVLFKLGRTEEAIAAYEESIRLEPNYRAFMNLGTLYFYDKNDFEKAAALFRRALELNDQDHMLWGNLGAALRWLELDEFRQTYSRAIQIAEERLKLEKNNARLLAALAEYHAVLGQKEKSLSFLNNALQLAPADAAIMYRAACIYGHRFELPDDAFAWLSRAVHAGYPWKEIEKAPALAVLRNDRRFAELRALSQQTTTTTIRLEGDEHGFTKQNENKQITPTD